MSFRECLKRDGRVGWTDSEEHYPRLSSVCNIPSVCFSQTHTQKEGGREGWRKSEIQETRSIIFYYTIQTHGDIETIMISTAVNSLPYLSTFCEPFNVGSDSITSYSNVFPESKNRHFPLECHTIIIHY